MHDEMAFALANAWRECSICGKSHWECVYVVTVFCKRMLFVVNEISRCE